MLSEREKQLVEALEAVVNERYSELDMMSCKYPRGSAESEAWHDGVKQAWKLWDMSKQPARDALMAVKVAERTSPAESAQPAEPAGLVNKPKCPECNSVGMSHCSDPEHCGGVYWPDEMYRKLETENQQLQQKLDEALADIDLGEWQRARESQAHLNGWDCANIILASRRARLSKHDPMLNSSKPLPSLETILSERDKEWEQAVYAEISAVRSFGDTAASSFVDHCRARLGRKKERVELKDTPFQDLVVGNPTRIFLDGNELPYYKVVKYAEIALRAEIGGEK